MLGTTGLYGHIRRNTLKSIVLLVAFFGLAFALWATILMLYEALVLLWPAKGATPPALEDRYRQIMTRAVARATDTVWIPLTAAALWTIIGSLAFAAIIRHVTRARPLSRSQHPRLYTIVENLSIQAGIPTPHIEIMPVRELNAYAAGLTLSNATIAVTQGLLDELSDDELEAVVAHEITHIRNRDVRLMVVVGVLASGLSLIGAALSSMLISRDTETMENTYWYLPGALFATVVFVISGILTALWLLAAVGVFTLLVKFAVSRSREFLADAGAVELTQNPDALISALKVISGRDHVPVRAAALRAMMFSFEPGDMFATHPSIAARISALKLHAGGQERPRTPPKVRLFGRWTRHGRALRNGAGAPLRG